MANKLSLAEVIGRSVSKIDTQQRDLWLIYANADSRRFMEAETEE